jgi:mannosyltransferase OCH1-like enzyme
MKDNIIQSLWVGPELGNMETLCIRSYLANGHDFHLYTFDEVRNIPEGTVVKNANDILPKEKIYRDAFGGFVNLSNQFRYTLLYKLGGWWVDMDTVCLKKFDFTQDFVFSSEFSEPTGRFMVNTTFIKSKAGAKFLSDCLDYIEIRGHENIHWGELGVNLISRMIFRNNLGEYIMLPESFCPVSPYQTKLFIHDTNYVLPEGAYAIHWWHEIWKRNNYDKNGEFPKYSLYEKMKSLYLAQPNH